MKLILDSFSITRNAPAPSTLAVIVVAILGALNSMAAQPKIDRIELLFTDLVTIHFDTVPSRKYELQYSDALLPRTNITLTVLQPANSWTNLFVAPAVPFPNHYVIADTRTNRHRFYRLRVTP